MITFGNILEFWFDEAGPKKWFGGGPAFDAVVRQRFEDFSIELAASLRRKFEHPWMDRPDGMLALIITLDQFPRNMFRDTKAMFAFDDLAIRLAKKAVDKGFDLRTTMARRSFFYMPYMHAEDIDDQNECVRLVDMRLESDSTLFHAKAHRDLIARFGRFAHRNVILGRQSTREELEFLSSGGYSP